ncbi:MMPL family transporter [Sphaerimonospora mesophila]|uniref:MMPL family transporter n=1 Tax=Sphaerimonospora mesophila TaxID=37483 RepID=UPI0006E15905
MPMRLGAARSPRSQDDGSRDDGSASPYPSDGRVRPGTCGRLGAALLRRGRVVVAAWLLLAVASAALLPGLTQRLSPPPLEVPGSRSAVAARLISQGFPQFGSEQMVLAFDSATLTATEPAYQRALAETVGSLVDLPGIGGMLPLPTGEDQDPHHAYVLFGVTGDEAARQRRLPAQAAAARQAVDEASGGKVTVTIVGASAVFAELVRGDLDDLQRMKVVTVPLVVLLLVLGLGAVGSAVVPLLVAGAAILVTAGVLSLLGMIAQVDSTQLTVALTVCLGIGLDYALLILLRYRQARRDECLPPVTAAVRAADTAGGTVSWCAVAIVLTAGALFTVPVPGIRNIALAVIVAALVTAAAASSLTPVLLPLLDPWLEWRSLPWRRLRRTTGRPAWLRPAGHLMNHPVRYALAVTALLLAAALPVLSLRLGLHYDRPSLAGTATGHGLVQMEADRMAGITGLVLPHPKGSGPVNVDALMDALEADPRVGPVAVVDNGRDLTVVLVTERNPPDSAASAALLRHIYEVAPRLSPPGRQMVVAGPTALLADLGEQMLAGLGLAIALVLLFSFLLLLVTFRSLLIAVKAVCMNMLSVTATFGLLALCFQHASPTRDVNLLVPLLTFTVVFGLSLDYEVFLVHRVAEHYRRTGDNTAAVLHGLRHTARPITLAAAVMTVAFASLLITHRSDLQQTGFAVAVAVAVDATLIRMILVPALMRLLGHRNWWLPRPLARLLPPAGSATPPTAASSGS